MVSVLNVGLVPSYVSAVRFRVLVNNEVQILTPYHMEDSAVGEWIRRMNSPLGSALEPGRKHSYYFCYTDFSKLSPLEGKPIHTLYPIGVQVDDEIGNSYTEDLPDDFRNSFLEHIPLHLRPR